MKLHRTAVALAIAALLHGTSNAQFVSANGGVVPYSSDWGTYPYNLGSVPIEIGNRMPGDWGMLVARSGGRMSAGGYLIYSGNMDLAGAGTQLTAQGAANVYVGYGRYGVLSVTDGAVLGAVPCSTQGTCSLLVGGVTGQPLLFTGDFPVSIDNGAKGDIIVDGPNSLVWMPGNFTLARAYVEPQVFGAHGLPGGGAAGVVNISNGGSLITGSTRMAVGSSGPGKNGTETAAAYVNISGPNSLWTIARNGDTNVQAQLVIGAPGDGASSGKTAGVVNISNQGRLRLTGDGGVLPGIVLASAGAGSKGVINVDGAGSFLELSGQTGFINIGGSSTANGGKGELTISNGAKVRGTSSSGLVFVGVGRRGAGAEGYVSVYGTDSLLQLRGRGDAGSGSDGQSAYLNVGRDGASGQVDIGSGGRVSIEAPATATPAATVSGAGFAIGRDLGTGRVNVLSGGVLSVTSADRRPNASIGNGGHGELLIAAGGRVEMIASNGSASGGNNALFVGGASGPTGSGDGLGGNGSLNIQGTGAVFTQSYGHDRLVAVANGIQTTGVVNVANGGLLETSAIVLGRGATAHATMYIVGGTVNLTGQVINSTSTGGGVAVGLSGSVGELYLNSGGRLSMNSVGDRAGLTIGGSSADAFGGRGLVRVENGSTIEIIDAGRNDHGVVVGRSGQGRLEVAAGGSVGVGGAGRVIVAAAPSSTGQVQIDSGGSLAAGRLLLVGGDEPLGANGQPGPDGRPSVVLGGAGTLVNNGLVSAGWLVAAAGRVSGSGVFSVAERMVLMPGATAAPGNSPGTMTIDGLLENAGGAIELEVTGSQATGWSIDHLVVGSYDPGTSPVHVNFKFLGSTDPSAFNASGGFHLEQFISVITAPGPADFQSLFANAEFSATAEAYSISTFSFSAASGVTALVASPVPESAPALLWAIGVAAWLSKFGQRLRSRRAEE